MLAVTGVFEDERFIPDSPIFIPQKKRVFVTIEEDTYLETNTSTEQSAYGCLSQYADPAKIESEKGAWERAVLTRYAQN